MITITSKEKEPNYDIIIKVVKHYEDKNNTYESGKHTVTLSELQEIKKAIDLYFSGKATHIELALKGGGSIYLSKHVRDKTSIEIKNITEYLNTKTK